jgi:serine/threonine-protein kinase
MNVKVILTVTHGALAGKRFILDHEGLFTIGRSNDCQIRVPNDLEFRTISRHHCVLEINLRAIRVRDLSSRNGTYINGMKIGRYLGCVSCPEAEDLPMAYDLQLGDELRVGELTFQVSTAAPEDGTEQLVQMPASEKPLHLSEPSLN